MPNQAVWRSSIITHTAMVITSLYSLALQGRRYLCGTSIAGIQSCEQRLLHCLPVSVRCRAVGRLGLLIRVRCARRRAIGAPQAPTAICVALAERNGAPSPRSCQHTGSRQRLANPQRHADQRVAVHIRSAPAYTHGPWCGMVGAKRDDAS